MRAVRMVAVAATLIFPCAVALAGDADASGPQSASISENRLGEPRVERGKYLAAAGNCISCHTQPGGAPFSGGVRFETPFGVIYSSNITPDVETGIGRWSENDLRRAMQEGIDARGSHMFPAFPYTSFTKVTNVDIDAVYAYLRTVKAQRYTPPRNGLFFAQRWALKFWNSLFFNEGRYSANASQSAEWNRGAYLVEGLGHCGECHTPRSTFMAQEADKAYQGGRIQGEVAQGKIRRWSAVNLTSAKSGLASWSLNDLAKYLHTGFSLRAGTFGPMNEVIVNSLGKLTAGDVEAMAIYLKSLPAREYSGDSVSLGQMQAGEPIYKDRCEKCHMASGRGGILSAPSLAGSAVVQAEDSASLINIIIYGPDAPKDIPMGSWETMKSYGDVLTDSEVAAVSNFIRGSWGNRAGPVNADDVARQR